MSSKVPVAVRKRLPGLSKKDGLVVHPWDEAHGVRTSGLVAGRHLKSGHAHDRHVTAYYGVAPSVFHALIKRWQRLSPTGTLEKTTFVDIGAGMGRSVLLAAEMPFRSVIGVELHPALARVARTNLTAWRKAGRAATAATVVRADAVEYALPSGDCVAFLFNPFGATVMRRWLRAMAAQFAERPRELDIVYVNCEQDGVLETQRGFRRLFLGKVKRSRPDAAADRRILENQLDGEYAADDYEDCSIWRWVGRKV